MSPSNLVKELSLSPRRYLFVLALGFGWGVTPSIPAGQSTTHVKSFSGITQPATQLGGKPETKPETKLHGIDLLKAIGLSEGTREIDGDKTEDWNSHIDPGNQAVNKGSCSWQKSPVASPAEADILCKAALEKILRDVPDGSSDLVAIAYLDAWIQSPAAAKDFFKLLQNAPGATEFDRIVYARVKAFINPDTGEWDAPGLGNNAVQINKDQNRRVEALQDSLNAQKS